MNISSIASFPYSIIFYNHSDSDFDFQRLGEIRDKEMNIRGAVAGQSAVILIVLIQVAYTIMHVTNKLALNSGMDGFVLITYRNLFASAFLLLLALIKERAQLVQALTTKSIFLRIVLSSFLGCTLNQGLYIAGLGRSSPTITAALGNLFPAFTFAGAVAFGSEVLEISTWVGWTKLISALVCIAGAMIMSFLRGPMLIRHSDLTWKALRSLLRAHHHSSTEVSWLGVLLTMGSCLSAAGWFINQGMMTFRTTQGKVSFSAPYATTCLMSLLASVQICVCAMIEIAISNNGIKAWRLGFDVGLIMELKLGDLASTWGFWRFFGV
ncbi:hypothetical protein MKW98_004755 [Papaver atlanticum]|uniref:WAT1-related protein n=1 Tax=Papaver atlanticum TaxID=357466 RepID=A0AAD4SQF0_9MAGN|nr:hypothetical protein MKW98_004755 [Papaver atlanticum]